MSRPDPQWLLVAFLLFRAGCGSDHPCPEPPDSEGTAAPSPVDSEGTAAPSPVGESANSREPSAEDGPLESWRPTSVATKAQFVQQLAETYCVLVERCKGAFPGDRLGADCVAERTKQLASREPLVLGVTDEYAYDPQAAEECLQEVAADVFCSEENWEWPPLVDESACDQVFVGSRNLSEQCEFDGQCAAGLACHDCTCQPRLGFDASCGPKKCQAGLRCLHDEFSHCRPIVGLGDDCRAGACARGLSCKWSDSDDPESERLCVLRSEDFPAVNYGEPCKRNLQCSLDQYCARPELRPEACVNRNLEGQPCGEDYQRGCADGLFCRSGGICTRLAEPQQRCEKDDYEPTCVLGSCIRASAGAEEFVCELRRGVGEPCESDEVCYSERCEGGVCRASLQARNDCGLVPAR